MIVFHLRLADDGVDFFERVTEILRFWIVSMRPFKQVIPEMDCPLPACA